MSDLVEQYEAMRKAIRENLTAIRSLLDQADKLNSLANNIDDDAIKKQLSKNVADLYKSINSLITHTNYLFDQFVKYAQVVEAQKQK